MSIVSVLHVFVFVCLFVNTYVAGVVELSIFHFSCMIITAISLMEVNKFKYFVNCGLSIAVNVCLLLYFWQLKINCKRTQPNEKRAVN